MLTFDGTHYRGVAPVPASGTLTFTDLILDEDNPLLFWTSFKLGTGDGGVSRFLNPLWQIQDCDETVLSLALNEPFVFYVSPSGVYRIIMK